MKLPYRTGDSFELPLGNGESTPATILECHHHFVDIAMAGRVLRVFDEALVLHRWRARRGEASVDYAPDGATLGMTSSPARAERTIAARLGVASFDDATRAVYEMHDDIDAAYLASLPPGALLAWTRPLADSTLTRIRDSFASRPDMRLRLHDGAASQAPAFSDAAIRELVLAGPVNLNTPFALVRELTLDTPLEQNALAEMFPRVTTLRVWAGAKSADLGAVARMTQLEHLDVSHVSSPDRSLERLAPLAKLRALRVARLDNVRSLRGLDALTNLRTLALEHLYVDKLAPLPQCTSLEQLELHGMWQFAIDDVAWLHGLPRLVRAEIDIGGRRKNLELYKRARWAYPWPTF